MHFLLLILLLTLGISQEKTIELEDVFNGTFSSSGIGRFDWINGEDAYYFSQSDSDGKHFYKYNVASDDTTKAFSIDSELIDQFSSTFSSDQTKLLLKTNNVKIWRHSSYGTYHIYDIDILTYYFTFNLAGSYNNFFKNFRSSVAENI